MHVWPALPVRAIQRLIAKLDRTTPKQWERLTVLLLAPFVIFFSLYRLEHYPTILGWDEGAYLEFARNVAFHGEYGTRDGHGFDRLSPTGGTGPTLILPIAVAFRLLDDSLFIARVIMAAYLLAFVTGAYLLVRQVGGRLAAACSVPLVLVAGHDSWDTLFLGRQVFGEIPALAFLLFALWCWVRSWLHGSRWLITAAALFCLAVLTKNQLLMYCGPAVVLIGLADRVYYHQLAWRHTLVPLAAMLGGYCAWFVAALAIIGPQQWSSYLQTKSMMTRAQFGTIDVWHSLWNVGFVVDSGQILLVLLGLLGGVLVSRHRSVEGLSRLVLTVFASVSLASFVAVTISWSRLLYPALLLAALCASVVLADCARWLRTRTAMGQWGALAIILVIVASLSIPRLWDDIERIENTEDSAARVFATSLDMHVPPDELVLAWEWEIDFLSNALIVHPPFELFPATMLSWRGVYDPILAEPRIPAGIQYVVLGPWGSDYFLEELQRRQHDIVLEVEPYSLIRLDD